MALGGLRKARKAGTAAKLQLTSMMDMFTIILIFLLFSFSDNPETMNLEKQLKLPESSAKLDSNENIKLVLTQSELLLEGNMIAKVNDGEILGFNTDNMKDSALYKELKIYQDKSAHLNAERETNAQPDEKTKSHILFLCDKHHSFKTINNVMKAAGMAGFPNFQFAVLNKDL